MTLEFIGLVGAHEASESDPGNGQTVDLPFIKAFAQTQEYAGFDKVLLAVNSRAPDSMIIASYVAALTDKLGLLVAHRPGFQAPTFAARQFATLDQLSQGRAAINVITGGDSGDLQRDGDFLDKERRYARSGEYLAIMKQVWASQQPFSHKGAFYQVEDNLTEVKPWHKPRVPIYFSGASAAAVEVAAQHADVYMMWGEPLDQVKARIAEVRAAAKKVGREDQIRFSLSLRPILGATDEEAWQRADHLLAQAQANIGGKAIQPDSNAGSQRLYQLATARKVYDRCLWTGIAALSGAAGNSTSLVGSPQTVADAALEYYKLGITTFLFRGFDQLRDAAEYGRLLLPAIRARVAAYEAEQISAA
ncbi:LLM class flavin-dependent oxidoreductase [Pantoea latae]|uniref:Alkanesulfonate monooxygenase n=1 Tax=Pantoea latae TaxID=1964541 RepID=A0A1V9DA37_9GAMM|nr:LLM class flavin-dependent oxidoreductase [Pantoea latae]OQP30802.1 alkanesulfonate monooxygenase [Pantoea latae]